MLNRSADTPFRAFEKRVLFRSLSEARVLSAIQQLMETLSGVSRQTIDPKALDAGLNRIAADFAAIHQVAGDLVFEELQSNLKVCDRLLSISAQNQDFVRGLIFLMLQRNVRRFVFTEGVTTAEIGELIRLLSYPDDGDLPTAIARAGLSHIEAQDQVEAHSPYDDIFSTFATLDERIDAVSTEFRIPAFDQPPADDEDAIKTISNLVDEAEAVPYTVGGDVDDEDDGFDEDEPDAGEPERVEDAAGEPIEPGAAPRSALDGDLNDMIELGDFGSEDEQLLHESGGEDPAPDDFERRADSARIENEPTTPFGPPLDTMGDSEVPADGIDAPPDFDWEPSMEADAVSEPDAPLEDGDEPVVSADALDAMEFEDVDDAGDLPAPPDPEPAKPIFTTEDEIPARVIVRVGRFALEDAVVKVRDDVEVVTRKTQGEDGAVFLMPPGEYEMEIEFDAYRVEQTLAVHLGMAPIEIDLQTIFDY